MTTHVISNTVIQLLKQLKNTKNNGPNLLYIILCHKWIFVYGNFAFINTCHFILAFNNPMTAGLQKSSHDTPDVDSTDLFFLTMIMR